MCAAVVTGVDASPVLEPAEHDLDFVALSVERAIMGENIGNKWGLVALI